MKFLLLIPVIFLLTGCFASSKPIQVENRIEPIPVFHPPLPEGVVMAPIEWKVWTPDRMRAYLKDLDEGKAPTIVFYGLTTKQYENLSGNMAELKRYIKAQQAVIKYYRDNIKTIKVKEVEVKNDGT